MTLRVLACCAALLVARSAAADEVSFLGSLDAIAAAQGYLVAASDANPDNRVLRIPSTIAAVELRPSLRWDLGAASLVLRPRFVGAGAWTANGADLGAGGTLASTYAAELVELYGVWNVSERLTLAYGLQNFQWGPAEIMSPSNRLFHQTGYDTTPLTIWYGQHLFRANVSLGKSWSAVFLLEPRAAADGPSFNAGDDFTPKGQVKLEYATISGAAYVGVTAGDGEAARAWFGEYGMWQITDAVSVYADVVHTRGSRAWYPVLEASGPTWARRQLDDDRLFTLGVVGARYTWQGGVDLRAEVVHHDAGWDGDEVARAVALVRAGAALAPATVLPYLAPGLELVGKDYAYASLLLPELGCSEALTLHARYLVSLRDGSGGGSLTGEWLASGSLSLYFSLSGVHGPRDGELDRFVRGGLLIAAKHSW